MSWNCDVCKETDSSYLIVGTRCNICDPSNCPHKVAFCFVDPKGKLLTLCKNCREIYKKEGLNGLKRIYLNSFRY